MTDAGHPTTYEPYAVPPPQRYDVYGNPIRSLDQQPLGAPRTSGRAIWSLVLGIVTLAIGGPIFAIFAVRLARKAKAEIDASYGTIGGRGLATAGFWCALVGTLVWIVVGILISK
jgi:hypothetical protein